MLKRIDSQSSDFIAREIAFVSNEAVIVMSKTITNDVDAEEDGGSAPNLVSQEAGRDLG